MKTASGLIAYAMSVKDKYVYMYGNNGWTITESLIQQKANQYPKIYTNTYINKLRKDIGKIGIDCSGLIDTYIGVDKSADGWYSEAKERGLIKTMPDIAGILVHHTGHIGIYIGNGQVIEANGIDRDIIVRNISEGNWVRWSKCPLLDYDTIKQEADKVVKNSFTRPSDSAIFKYGSRGIGVKWCQQSLNNAGFNCGLVDGIFGKNTDLQVRSFQKKHGLKVDGIIGKRTMAVLDKYN